MSSPVGIKLVLDIKVLNRKEKKIKIEFKKTLVDNSSGHEFKPEEVYILIGCCDKEVRGLFGTEWVLENTLNPFTKEPSISEVAMYEDHVQEYKFEDERGVYLFRLFWEFLVKLKGFKVA